MKVSIIGAGIGGLTTGIALQQAGFEVHIYEREAELLRVGAGLTLWANAIDALEQLDLGNKLSALSIKTQEFGLYNQNGKRLAGTDITELKKIVPTPSVVVHRADLQSILLEHFKGTIHYAKSLCEYGQRGDQVYLNFTDGSIDYADLLVACDGIHSAVRKQMKPRANPVYAGYTSFRGVIPFDHERVGQQWGEAWGTGQRFGILPLPNNKIYWYATVNADEGRIVPQTKRQQKVLDSFKDWYTLVKDIIQSTHADIILQHDTYDLAPLNNWRDGRVILSGDAAHAMTPNMGQGACQAIEDGVTLGKLFANTNDIDSLLTQYQALRIPRANQVLKQSRSIGNVGQWENSLLCYLRNQIVKYSPKQLQTNNLSKLITYQV